MEWVIGLTIWGVIGYFGGKTAHRLSAEEVGCDPKDTPYKLSYVLVGTVTGPIAWVANLMTFGKFK